MAKFIAKPVKSSLPSPEDVLEVQLSNGITILARSNFNSPAISFGGYLPAGAIFESDEKLGLADFVATSLMRGTADAYLRCNLQRTRIRWRKLGL